MSADEGFKQAVRKLRSDLRREKGITLPPFSFEADDPSVADAPQADAFILDEPPLAIFHPSSRPDEASHLWDEHALPPDRRRGAKPRNLNALKHGFYSKNMDSSLRKALKDAGISNDLEAEISILRLKFRSLSDAPNASPELFLRTARTLARLISVQYRIKHLRKYKHPEETSFTNY